MFSRQTDRHTDRMGSEPRLAGWDCCRKSHSRLFMKGEWEQVISIINGHEHYFPANSCSFLVKSWKSAYHNLVCSCSRIVNTVCSRLHIANIVQKNGKSTILHSCNVYYTRWKFCSLAQSIFNFYQLLFRFRICWKVCRIDECKIFIL